jgi:3',5'-nucleoside bisphosphate phosphatase
LRVDLHIHSTASDGSLSPRAVVQAGRSGGLDVIALADHDTIAGVADAMAAAEGSVHVIPALEVSTHFEGAEVHVLGYNVDPTSPILTSFGVRASSRREERMRDMLDRLAGLDIEVAFDDVLAAAGTRPESIGRPHLARAMVNHGHVRTVADAFDLYIGDEGPAFVPTRLATPAEAITLIHEAGGVAVWAHPRLDTFVPGPAPDDDLGPRRRGVLPAAQLSRGCAPVRQPCAAPRLAHYGGIRLARRLERSARQLLRGPRGSGRLPHRLRDLTKRVAPA